MATLGNGFYVSTSGRVIEERRTQLKGNTVDSLLFLNDFYKKKM